MHRENWMAAARHTLGNITDCILFSYFCQWRHNKMRKREGEKKLYIKYIGTILICCKGFTNRICYVCFKGNSFASMHFCIHIHYNSIINRICVWVCVCVACHYISNVAILFSNHWIPRINAVTSKNTLRYAVSFIFFLLQATFVAPRP